MVRVNCGGAGKISILELVLDVLFNLAAYFRVTRSDNSRRPAAKLPSFLVAVGRVSLI